MRRSAARCGVCVTGAYCNHANATCVAYPVIGDACHTDRFGHNPFCAEDAYCVEDVCEPLPSEGEPCAPGYEKRCAPGLLCRSGSESALT